MRIPPPVSLLAAALVVAHCAPAPQAAPPVTVVVPQASPSASTAPSAPATPVTNGGDEPGEENAAVPILRIDPAWGSRNALVTIVAFGDFQCPFTARTVKTLHALEDKYGPDALRVVWKNDPLPWHPHAREAAEAAEAVQMLAGSEAFWKFHQAAFANQPQLDPSAFDAWAQAAAVDVASFHQLVLAHAGGAKVDSDVALAKTLKITGTPAFYVNGVSIDGAQPEEKFAAVIDAELEKARKRLADGTSPELLYVAMAKENFHPRAMVEPVKADTTTVWKVPVTGAPARGTDNALVTIVEFADFQCPFSKRAEPVVEQIRTTYGDKVRVVWRDEPLSNHTRAVPAAALAREARAQKGSATFWTVHDALFASQPKLDDSDLETIAIAAGLNATKAHDAVTSDRYKADIDKDVALAHQVQAGGTPTFFINGRKLTGAWPFERYQTIIDEEIAHAQAVVAKGTSRAALYETLIHNGQTLTTGSSGTAPKSGVPGATTTLPGGLTITDLALGTGATAEAGDHVTVHYVGTLKDGTEFDSSRKHGHPFSFPLGAGHVIKGWDQGLQGMRVGGRRKLEIPASLAYGDRSVGSIPANADLVFEVELLSIP